MNAPSAPIVVVSSEQLAQLVREAVRAELAQLRPEPAASAHELLSVQEAAERLRCSTRQVRRYVTLGRLRSTKLGTRSARLRIPRAEVERLLAESTG